MRIPNVGVGWDGMGCVQDRKTKENQRGKEEEKEKKEKRKRGYSHTCSTAVWVKWSVENVMRRENFSYMTSAMSSRDQNDSPCMRSKRTRGG